MDDFAPGTVLIADDEADVRLLVRIILAEVEGVEVIAEAVDGDDALEKWCDLRRPAPQVVVLDNRMPGLTGLEVAARILEARPTQPILLFSAFLSDDIRQEAAAAGIRACVSKSDLDTLAGLVRGLLLSPA